MGSEVAIYEREFNLIMPTFEDVLRPIGMPAARLIRTVLIALERSESLRACTLPSVMQAAVTLACLGLESDGVTGQGFLVPFKEKGTPKAQTIIGYKGYNTMASRSGYSIRGAAVFEGDNFKMNLGDIHNPIYHEPDYKTPIAQRKMIGTYSLALSNMAPPLVCFLPLDDILVVRKKSKGAWYQDGNPKKDSPWHDAGLGEATGSGIGFVAMAEKTSKRRLSRSMPLNTFVRGAIMEEAYEERGKHSFIDPRDGIVIDHADDTASPLTEVESDSLTTVEGFPVELGSRTVIATDIDDWHSKMRQIIETKSPDAVKKFRELNGPVMGLLHGEGYVKQVAEIDAIFSKRLTDG